MTRVELASILDRLDPGAVLALPADLLALVFPGTTHPHEPTPEIERFAEEHRCTFCPTVGASAIPQFIKSDVY